MYIFIYMFYIDCPLNENFTGLTYIYTGRRKSIQPMSVVNGAYIQVSLAEKMCVLSSGWVLSFD